MVLVELLALRDIKIAFSPSGHGLMTLIISFLGLAKVNLSYERYMSSRHSIGHALSSLRELNQTAMTFVQYKNGTNATRWREEVRSPRYHCEMYILGLSTHVVAVLGLVTDQVTTRIVDLLDCTVRVLKVCSFVFFSLFEKLASFAHPSFLL